MPRRLKHIPQTLGLEPGDTVTVGPNNVLMAEGTIGTFLFYSECGPPIIEVADRGRFLVPERSLTVHARPCVIEPAPEIVPYAPPPDVPDLLSEEQSEYLLGFIADRDKRGATLSPYRAPARRSAIMPLAWEDRTTSGEPTLERQLHRAQWDVTGLAAWVDRLQPVNDREQVALHELWRAMRETRYWLEQVAISRGAAVTA